MRHIRAVGSFLFIIWHDGLTGCTTEARELQGGCTAEVRDTIPRDRTPTSAACQLCCAGITLQVRMSFPLFLHPSTIFFCTLRSP